MNASSASRVLSAIVVGGLLIGWANLGSASGAFTAHSENSGSSLTLADAPAAPTDFTVSVDVDDPPTTCSALLGWTSSVSPQVTGYVIERIETVTELVVGGPWAVGPATTSYVDVIPLQPVGQPYSWRIHAVVGPWASLSATSTDFDLAACSEIG